MDPHTAVAMGAYMKELEAHPEDGARHTIIASRRILSSSQHLSVRRLILRLVLHHMKVWITSRP